MTSVTLINSADMSGYDAGNFQAIRGLAASSNGSIIYAIVANTADVGILKSVNGGVTYNTSNPSGSAGTSWFFTSIACSSDGTIVYACYLGQGLYKSVDSGATWNYVYQLGQALPGGAANPENSIFGYDAGNVDQVACDATGTILIMTTNACATIYLSNDGGVSWTDVYVVPNYSPTPNTANPLAMNATGSVMYAAFNNSMDSNNYKILTSVDMGVTWNVISALGTAVGPFDPIATNLTGDFAYGCNSSGLNVFYEAYSDLSFIPNFNGSITTGLAIYSNGYNIAVMVNNEIQTYAVTNKYPPGSVPTRFVACFMEGSKILCYKNEKEVYTDIQDIRKGDLVKTLRNGHVPVNMIGYKKMYHPASSERVKDQLYKCSPDNFPELTEDLILTGCHSILVNQFESVEQEERAREVNGGRIFVTDKKYRLPASVDDRTDVYDTEGVYTVYHLALENDDYYMNYGIYANGLLVETCSKRYLKELSEMTLVD